AQIQNFEAYWNQVSPENAGKWGSVEGIRDNMNWGGLDAAYALAKDNGFPFHFHVLIWGAQQPGWIDDDTLTTADQLEEITEWFQEVANRYPNIDYLEVVNEPLPNHNPPDGTSGRANYKEALGGDGTTGWDWVVNAFQMARDIFPAETKLMINDFGILSSTSSTAQYLGIIRLLQSQDLIDIIGVQGHAFTTTAPTVTMIRNLDSLATTGLPIQVTELDIDGPSDAIQLQDYQRIFPALYEHPGVEGITLWGWRPGLWRASANLINNDGSERPALEWLRTYLDTVDVTVSIEHFTELPIEFNLSNNYPNPFNPSTTIKFALPKSSKVRLSVYNLLGQEVAVVLNQNVNAGYHEITFNGSDLSSGVYFYKLVAGEFIRVKKMMLVK
ncbi:MAG: endo-1,4-beta-xylanase, partial [Calditrichota bacterium]